MTETLYSDGQLLAVIVRSTFRSTGIVFFTPEDLTQQLAYMNRPKGYQVDPHFHNNVTRQFQGTLEVLFVRSGNVRIDLYCVAGNYLGSKFLESGDVILLAGGGHGLEMLEPSEIMEVKQGPYVGELDKTKFDPVGFDEVRIFE